MGMATIGGIKKQGIIPLFSLGVMEDNTLNDS